jgi:C4-dicarboxylate-specific signal transduction histidine kinase
MEKRDINHLFQKLEKGEASLDEIQFLKKEYFFLESELQKFKQMVDWTPCTISWIRDDLTYIGVNQTLSDICEVDVKDFVGRKVGSHTQQEYFKEFAMALFASDDEARETNLSTQIEGEDKDFFLVGRKFNEAKEAVIIGLDITELARLQKPMVLMERLSALGEMVAGIVHEINNPLTVIKNQAKMIDKYQEKGQVEKIGKASESIQRTSEKMTKIIEGVKSFVRQGQHDPATEAFVNETLVESAMLLESKFKEAQVELSLPQGDGPTVTGNQTQLFQVFVNLMTNSIDAIIDLEKRWIKIEMEEYMREGEKVVRLRFHDSGPGITKELEEKIFQSFFTTKEKGKGTGLGLSLCKRILQAHGGDLWIDHESDHTCFVVDIPALADRFLAKAS